MRPFPSSVAPAARSLGRRLAHLRQTLDGLGAKLRESIAHAVGQTVAGAVQEAVRAALADQSERPPAFGHRHRTDDLPRSLWNDPDDAFFDEDEPDEWPPEDEDEALTPAGPATPDVARSSPWPRAVSFGLQAAAWWLRRRAGRCSVLAALSVGLLTCAVAYTGGPLAATVISLSGAALSLSALSAGAP